MRTHTNLYICYTLFLKSKINSRPPSSLTHRGHLNRTIYSVNLPEKCLGGGCSKCSKSCCAAVTDIRALNDPREGLNHGKTLERAQAIRRAALELQRNGGLRAI